MSGDEHVPAEISVEPAAAGEEHNHMIRQAIQALSGPDLVVTVGAMSTTVEGPLDDVPCSRRARSSVCGHPREPGDHRGADRKQTRRPAPA